MSADVPYEAIPSGWYVVAEGRELAKGAVKELRCFGRDLVLYRTASGEPRLVDAYCPHLGAHLGDGRVVDESLRCPFHGFEFGSEGRCVRTPYPGGRPPAKARLESLPLRENGGFLLAWYDRDGRAPWFETPDLELEGWTGFAVHGFHFRGHPQEVSENSVDLGHFGPVHAYARAEVVDDAVVEGHVLRARYAVVRALDFIGLPGEARLAFSAEVHGLGLSMVRAEVKKVGVDVRLLVLPTPIEVDQVHLRVAVAMKKTPVPALTWLVHKILLRAYVHDVGFDVPIWARKRYVAAPILAHRDGPIPLYRRYVQQFYPPRRVSLDVAAE